MKLLFALLLTLLLAGCDADVAPTVPTVEKPTVVVETPVEETVETPVEEPAETPEPDEGAPADLPERLLSTRELVSDDGSLWYVADENIEQNVMQQLLYCNKRLVAWGTVAGDNNMPNVAAAYINLETSQTDYAAHVAMRVGNPIMQVCGDRIAVADWEKGYVSLFSPGETFDLNLQNTPIYLSTDATTAYLSRRDSGITAVELATGEESTLLTADSVLLSAKCGDTVTFSYTNAAQDTVYAALDLTDGGIAACPYDELRFGVEALDDLWLGAIDDETWLLGEHRFTMPADCGAATLLDDGRLMLYAATPEQMTLYLYETDGSFVSRCILPEGYQGPNSDPVWVEADGGYYLLAAAPEGHDVLLFWDLSCGGSGEDLPLSPIE